MASVDIVKTWSLQTVDGQPYKLGVLSNASLWLQFGTGDPVELEAPTLIQAMSEAGDTISAINTADATCPFTKPVLNGQFTLACDLPNRHSSQFHHDPQTQIYYLPDL